MKATEIILHIYFGMNIFMCGNYYANKEKNNFVKWGMYILTGLFGSVLFIAAVGWDWLRYLFNWVMGVTQTVFYWNWYLTKKWDKIPNGEILISIFQRKEYLLKLKKASLQQRSLLKCIDKIFIKHNITPELIEEIRNNDNHPLREHKLKKEEL